MKRLLLFIFFIQLAAHLFAQSAQTPQLRCVHVKENGSGVSLYFIPIADSTNFLRYEVYYSDLLAGPYQVINNNMTTANTDCFDGVDPVVHNYYFLKAVYQNGEHNSDTLATIRSSINNPGDGTAIITWNAPADQLLPTTSNLFRVMRRHPNDIEFRTVGTVEYPGTLSFRDTIVICDNDVDYRVQLSDQFFAAQGGSVCQNASTISTEQFSNLISPHIPTLNQVTVDYTTDQIILTWDMAQDEDVNAYVIFYQETETSPWTPIDTVYGITTTTWIDSIHTSDVVNHYRISARDSCGNASAMTLEMQQNMLLHCTTDACSRKASLSWTHYVNMTGGLEKYEILYAVNGGALQYAGEVPANTTTFTHSDLVPDNDYTFIVRAVSANGLLTADSRKFSFTFTAEETNDYAYICAVSVEENQHIRIQAFTSGAETPFEHIDLYRSCDNTQNFQQIGVIPFNGGSQHEFTDYDVDVNAHTYYYKMELYNECAPEPAVSNIAHSILLRGFGDAAHHNTLQWMDYDDGVDSIPAAQYAVHRKMETDLSFVEIANNHAPEGYNNYTDDVTELYLNGADFRYKVSTESFTCEFGECPESFSNEIILTQNPTTFIPNAFMGIGNSNRVFKPVNSFVSTSGYIFEIYNRWGVKIFSTNDPYSGWDGTINGELAPGGVYVYRIEYLLNDGTPFKRNGTVTFIR